MSLLAESIAKRSDETPQIVEAQKGLNQTAENEEIYRRTENKKDLKNEIYPVWQGYMDEDRTFYSVNENTILETRNF